MASPFRCIDLTCCKAVALEEARGRQSSPSADAGRLRVLYRLSARTALARLAQSSPAWSRRPYKGGAVRPRRPPRPERMTGQCLIGAGYLELLLGSEAKRWRGVDRARGVRGRTLEERALR